MLAENIQSLGGKARAESLTEEQRREIARKGGQALASIPKATHEGEIRLNETISIPCAVLEDGTRLITQRGMYQALGRYKNPNKTGSIAERPGFLGAKNLTPFISKDLVRSWEPIKFRTTRSGGLGGNIALGYRAEILPMVCHVFEDAERAHNVLKPNQQHIADAARVISRSFSKLGIIALVDEATGYQYDRARDALARILEKFIAQELQPWTKTFPMEFYQNIFRLRGWPFNPNSVRRPQVIAAYTRNCVYRRLAPGVYEELLAKNPVIDGRRKHKLFQWLTGEVGHPKLRSHLDGVIALMRVSDSWGQFMQFLNRAYPRYEKMELGFTLELRDKT
jgi:hypothetical protein